MQLFLSLFWTMNYLNCQLSEPIQIGNDPAKPDWEFSKMTCDEMGTTMITDGQYTAYISSKITLGDIFVMGFLIFLFGVIIFKFLWDFIYPKIFKIKTKLDL
jgi:hypothetical protein